MLSLAYALFHFQNLLRGSKTTGTAHKRIKMNPKAIRAEEMFGETDKLSGEWLDGIFAAMWSKFNDRNKRRYFSL